MMLSLWRTGIRHAAFVAPLLLLVACPVVGWSEVTPEIKPKYRMLEHLSSELIQTVDDLVVDLDFTPDGRLFYVVRTGSIHVLDPSAPDAAPIEALTLDVAHENSIESGLLGVALSPDFEQDHHVYVHYVPMDEEGNPREGRVERYTERDDKLGDPVTIIANLPYYPDQLYHFGGALSFGPDGKLYLIVGDGGKFQDAQNPSNWYGTILRFNRDGTIPADNPFPNSHVYAYGVRNGFGLAWSPETGLLYENENGDACDDELNLVEAGANLGWGRVDWDTCPHPDERAVAPIYQWTPTSSPADMLFYTGDAIPEWKNDLLLCAHNRRELHHFQLSADGRAVDHVEIVQVSGLDEVRYTCRVALAQGPDGEIYYSTESGIHRIEPIR